MTFTMDGLPASMVFLLATGVGTFSDVSNEVDRLSVSFQASDPGTPRRLSFKIKRRNQAVGIHEGLEMRVYVDNGAGAAYSRLYGGYVVDIDEGPKAQYEEVTVTLLCYNSLLTRGSMQITDAVIVGGYSIWQPLTAYTHADLKIVPTADNTFFYFCKIAGTSGPTEPVWPLTVGGEVTDGTVQWENNGLCTRTDKQAVEWIVANYLPECTTAVNKHVDNLPQILLEWETVQSALAKVAVQAGSNNYPVWQASHAYALGTLLQAQPPNAYFYDTTTAGTTGGTPPGTWPTTLGATVTSGTAVFTCRGNVVVAPFAHITVSPDNVAHTNPWNKVLGWYDLNSFVEIPTLGFTWVDNTVEDSTHFRYDTVPKRHRDGSQYRNTQTVQGALGSEGTVTDTGSQAYVFGRVVSGPIVKDDTLTTNVHCINAAWVVLGSLAAGVETITFTSMKCPVDPRQLLQGVFRVPFTNARMSLSGVQYYASVGLTFGKGGIAQWAWQLGAAPQSLGQNGLPRAMGGARYLSDLTAPGAPQWPAGGGWLLQAQYNCNTEQIDEVIEWLPPIIGPGAVLWYDIYGRHSDEFYTRYLGRVDSGVLSLEHSCNPGVGVTYTVRAIGTEPGPLSDPRVAAAVPVPDPPHAPVITYPTDYSSSEYGPNLYHLFVTVHKNAPGDDASQGGWVHVYRTNGLGGDAYFRIPEGSTFPFQTVLSGYHVGDDVYAQAWIINTCGQASALSPVGTHYVIPSGAPHAPVITYPTDYSSAPYGPNLYNLFVTVHKNSVGDDASGGGWVHVFRVGGTDQWFRIPPGSTFPYQAVLSSYHVGEQVNAVSWVINQWDEASALSPTTANYTIPNGGPHAPVTTAGTQGHNSGGYTVPITVTKFSVGDDATNGGWIKYSTGGVDQTPIRIPAGSGFPYTFLVSGLLVATYSFRSSIIDALGNESADSTPISVVITQVLPPAPTITNPIAFHHSLEGYIATPVINSGGGDTSGGGEIDWVVGLDGIPTPLTHTQIIPKGATFPFTGYCPVDVGATYTFTATVRDGSGQSSVASAPVTVRISNPIPMKQAPPGGWASGVWGPLGEQILAGWLPVAPAVNADFAIVADGSGANDSTLLQASLHASSGKAVQSPPFSCTPLESRVIQWSARGEVVSVLSAKASIQPQSWDGQEAHAPVSVGGLLQIGSTKTLGTSFPSKQYVGKVAIPAGATQFVIILEGDNSSGTSRNIFFSYPNPNVVGVQQTYMQGGSTDPLIDYDENGDPVTGGYWSPGARAYTRAPMGGSPTYDLLQGHAFVDGIGSTTLMQGGNIWHDQVSLIPLYFNVKDFGAKGDGTTDDTAAVQNAINAAITSHLGATVMLPAGTYKITAFLSVNSVQGFCMRGIGHQSEFLWAGNSTDPMFKVIDTRESSFEWFRIVSTVSFPLSKAFQQYRSGASVSVVSHRNRYRNLWIDGTASYLTDGIVFGGTGAYDANNDFNCVDECYITNYTNSAVAVTHSQCYGNLVRNTHMVGQAGIANYGVFVSAGYCSIENGSSNSNGWAYYDNSGASSYQVQHITGLISEGDTHLAYSHVLGGLTISNCRWSADVAPDGGVMCDFSGQGRWRLIDNIFGDGFTHSGHIYGITWNSLFSGELEIRGNKFYTPNNALVVTFADMFPANQPTEAVMNHWIKESTLGELLWPETQAEPLLIPFVNYTAAVQPFAANANPHIGQLTKDCALNIFDADCSTFVSAPNSGVAFWTVNVYVVHSNGTQTKVLTFDTSADAAATWTAHDTIAPIGGTVPLAKSDLFLYSELVKTGAPGSIFVTAPAVQTKKWLV